MKFDHLVNAKLDELRVQAKRLFNVEVPPIVVKYDLKGNTAGYMSSIPFDKNLYRMRLNTEYLGRFTDEMINRTVPHEFCHLLSVTVYGYRSGRGHGPCWRNVMTRMGLEPHRTHKFGKAQSARKFTKYKHTCSHETITFTIKIANKLRRGAQYRHRECACPIEVDRIEWVRE